MTELGKNMIDYFVICVNEFAKQHDISKKDSMATENRGNSL